jgi:hypothetical protein
MASAADSISYSIFVPETVATRVVAMDYDAFNPNSVTALRQ